ncbi:trafficking protein particle complex subunit 8-like [Choristoneura fumiferana]|uniref:trafficking protein particle complex subunit 8-like n=1 Tax=Choristoneura fumiferana TaxID=7141 RepID=UPI003D15E8FC
MAKSGKTAQEFIQNSFSPVVAVLCSPKVDNITAKNNLSFTELLQPFTSLDFEGQIREPSGGVCVIKNWKLIVRDVHWKPLPPTEARKQLNNAVLYNYNDKTVLLEIDGHKFDVPQSTPWFDAWRETYLEVQFPSDHEYTKHFLSCIIVGTTLDDNIVDTFNSLNQQYAQLQNVTPPKLPKWFNQGVLKSYLLLHDVSAVARDKAEAAFETLKQTFGSSNCFMLSINSKSTTDPSLPLDFWAQYIKRSNDSNSEMSSGNLPTTPPDPQPFPTVSGSPEDGNTLTASIPPEGMHPLTTSENDIYDNANSLQTHSFSGSSESMNVSVKPLDYSTEVHGLALNALDVESIKKFTQEYALKALLPFVEKQISQLSEVVANRKGVSRSLLSATKRWFGTGKGGNTTGNNTVIYSSECPELQLRRLGDLWFLCGQWQRAFDTYHTAKREFYADSAWLCYAGALEMAAVSAFMAGDANKKTHGYMEESIVTYLNTCRMVQYAVRATLLSVLCLSSSGSHGEAAKQLIRMTSEDSDLRSAMLLEQASLCFLSGPGTKAMCRKYAFHMVLAGHRFSKAGQKKHAYRCYNQAYQVYAASGWRLSTDHVQFALGRLASALRLTRDAVRWLGAPLAPAARALQPAHQQDAFLREYMLAHQQWVESSEEFKEHLPVLPLPLLESEATAVLCVGPAPLSSPGREPASSLSFADAATRHEERVWHKLEEMLLQVAQGSVPMIFKPTVDLYTSKTDRNPVVPQGEPIQISITLRNPLKIVTILKDVELLWQFVANSDDLESTKQILNNELMVASGSSLESSAICGQKIKSVILEGESSKSLIFSITPLQIGQLCVQGVAYKLINGGEGGNENTNGSMILGKLDLLSEMNASDKLLQITVIPQAPCLQMTFTESNRAAISGELRVVDVELRNVGPVDMGPVYFAAEHPDCVHLLAPDPAAAHAEPFRELYEEKYKEPTVYTDERAARAGAWRAAAARRVRVVCGGVARGACARVRLVMRARAAAPALALLAYYEPARPPSAPARTHRLLRHVFRFTPTVRSVPHRETHHSIYIFEVQSPALIKRVKISGTSYRP